MQVAIQVHSMYVYMCICVYVGEKGPEEESLVKGATRVNVPMHWH